MARIWPDTHLDVEGYSLNKAIRVPAVYFDARIGKQSTYTRIFFLLFLNVNLVEREI